ncbi:MAG: LysE family translocator [Betaproteobacteria bacterium]|nr:LysE family translocator [Betaproteobacteria bacterium]NBP45442.1 LysE family translocator [Betaproteobacteria bacterium]
MTSAEFTALLILATATSFTPGPNTTLSTTLAVHGGLRHALRFVLAVPVGWAILLALCGLGVGSLVQAWPLLRVAIVLGGMAYLLWLAKRLWGVSEWASSQAMSLEVGFVQGVMLQFLNIKAWMLALSVTAGWIAGQADEVQRLMQVMPVMVFYAFASNFSYALVGSLLRQWLAQGRRLQVFNRVMATALVFTALWMLKGL